MIGTNPDARGGIASVVAKYRQFGLFEKWKVTYLFTHVEGSLGRKLAAAFLAYGRLVALLLTGRVGLLHIHIASRASTWRKSVFALTAFLFRVPYVLHIHGGKFIEFFNNECGPARRRIIRELLNRAGSVIALSDGWAAQLRTVVPTARIETVHNSVPVPTQQAKCDQNDGNKEILFLGKIGSEKGAFDLIRAFAVIGQDAQLVFGGNGEVDSASKLARQLGVSDRVHFAGWISGAEKEARLAAATVFALPSYNEGLPMSVLEAMAWGIPVVVTPVGGIPELVRQAKEGLIVQPGDIDGLASALRTLLDNPRLRTRLGANGRSRVQQLFSDAVVFPKLEVIWMRFGLAPFRQPNNQ